MPYSNISATLPQEDVDAIKAALVTINNKLPFLISLSNDERRSLVKMGPKSINFVQDSLRVAQNNVGIVPQSFDVDEFSKDVSLVVPLTEITMLVNQLGEKLNDTQLAVGGEAMRGALAIYDYTKTASKHQPGLKLIVEALGQRFKEQGSTKKVSPQEN